MGDPKTTANDWDQIFHALGAKTKEIQERDRTIDEEYRPYSEAGRWAVHLRRIADEIILFMNGN